MPSKLGTQIRGARTKKGISLREFARLIGKSPAFITRLECEDQFPAAAPETLRAIAETLELDADSILLAAGKAEELAPPKNTTEVALYRKVQTMSRKQQEELLEELNRLPRKRE